MTTHSGTLTVTLTSGDTEQEFKVDYTASLDSPDPSVGITNWTVQDVTIEKVSHISPGIDEVGVFTILMVDAVLNAGDYNEKILEDFHQNPPGRDADDLRDEQIDRELDERDYRGDLGQDEG